MEKAVDIIALFEAKFTFTIKDVEAFEKDFDREVARSANILSDFYYSDNKDQNTANEFLAMATKAGQLAFKLCKGVYVNEKELKRRLLEAEFPSKVSGFFPLPVYVSASRSDKMTIGVLVHFNGKLEMFEGNDEATPETISAVNRLLGMAGKRQIVYAMHTEDVVEKIRDTGIIPQGLYVSPNRKHAEGYWNLKKVRILFSCEVDLGDVAQESEYDWKILMKNTKVKKFRML